MASPAFYRLANITESSGLCRSSIYLQIQDGVFPPPVKLGVSASAWPRHEVEAIWNARIAGKTKDEIRALVVELLATRKRNAGGAA